jgi:hypothetical protein
MLTPIDAILFPDECCLIEIDNKLIFPIFKNASSSLISACRAQHGREFRGTEITNITDAITVFIREPTERFSSGIKTVVYNLKKTHSELDISTIEFLMQKYLFLDVHFLPQFHWLLNLSRFTGPDVKLKFCSIADVGKFTEVRTIPDKVLDIHVDPALFNNLYLQLDTIIFNQIGNELTFRELLQKIKNDDSAKFYELTNLPFGLMGLLL